MTSVGCSDMNGSSARDAAAHGAKSVMLLAASLLNLLYWVMLVSGMGGRRR